ncbi:MAG: peptide/nickel transport system ATP-binding protein [Candidatus Latescibacterota bacterium]|jgi:peptide/nickel transport system ATP-binding protein
MPTPILEIEDLRVQFRTIDGLVTAVNGVDLVLHRGETVGLVGESGSGKSVTAMSIMRLLAEPPAQISGSIRVQDKKGDIINITDLNPDSVKMQQLRGNDIAMIFQEPMRALSPVFTVGHQVAEAIWLHRSVSKAEALKEAIHMLDRVGIPDPDRRVREYPHQLSGGQRQRVMIAMALACRPALLIADEPTTALDVTIQAQIMELLNELQAEFNIAILLITHDLGIVAGTCSKVNVMYMGRIVEHADIYTTYENPAHPYTQGLLKSVPIPGQGYKERLPAIRGTVPDPMHLPIGCTFGPRCDHFQPGLCDQEGDVALVQVAKNHQARCYCTSETHTPLA